MCLEMVGLPSPFHKYSDWGLFQKEALGTVDAYKHRREDVTGGEWGGQKVKSINFIKSHTK